MHRSCSPLLPPLLLACLPLAMSGCDVVKDVLDSLEPPTGELLRVDLVKAPTVEQLGGWACYEFLGSATCTVANVNNPPRNQLLFSFDLVFDLHNPNKGVPIPLVELLLGFSVFDGANLGAACLSFCDPDVEDCVATTNAEGACLAGADDVDEPADLIPTIDDLFSLAESVVTGELDNSDWRVIPGKDSVEAHIQFDLDIDVMLDLADEILQDGLEDFIAGRPLRIDIPYTADGTLFFEAPELGRKGIGFGPFEDVWQLRP